MNALDHFSVPYKGLGNGIHHLKFFVDSNFFNEFEDAHLDNGSFEVNVELDKRFDHGELLFNILRTTRTSCDRCLSAINLPISGEYKLHVKHGEKEGSNDEIMFIHPETSILNLAQVIYEFISLSVPIIKTYDCDLDEEPPCNFEVLNRLNGDDDKNSEEEKVKGGIWDSLKDLDLSN